MSEAVLFVGPVGSGKSTALDVVERCGYEPFEMGEFARRYHDELGVRKSVSEWADGQRDRFGPTWLMEPLLDQASEFDRVAIDGVRSMESIPMVREQFDDVTIILLWASARVRFGRVEAREDGDGYASDFASFLKRDIREMQWGMLDIIEERAYDRCVVNEGVTLDTFRTNIEMCIEDLHPGFAPWETPPRSPKNTFVEANDD